VHDRTGSYDLALIMAAACMGAAALAAWWLPEGRVSTIAGESPSTTVA
jgi:hypothetical protein